VIQPGLKRPGWIFRSGIAIWQRNPQIRIAALAPEWQDCRQRVREDDTMEYRQISDDYSVSGQIQPEDIVAIKEAGFRSVICNRPDNEQPGQPSADSVQAAAEAAGLAFRYIPVISGQITMDNVEDQAEALDELEGPVFAYCRSGARCTNLYGLIQQQRR